MNLSWYKAGLSCVFSLLSQKPADDTCEPSIQAPVISVKLEWCQQLFTRCLCGPHCSSGRLRYEESLLFIISIINLTTSLIESGLFSAALMGFAPAATGTLHICFRPSFLHPVTRCSHPAIHINSSVASPPTSSQSSLSLILSPTSILIQINFITRPCIWTIWVPNLSPELTDLETSGSCCKTDKEWTFNHVIYLLETWPRHFRLPAISLVASKWFFSSCHHFIVLTQPTAKHTTQVMSQTCLSSFVRQPHNISLSQRNNVLSKRRKRWSEEDGRRGDIDDCKKLSLCKSLSYLEKRFAFFNPKLTDCLNKVADLISWHSRDGTGLSLPLVLSLNAKSA